MNADDFKKMVMDFIEDFKDEIAIYGSAESIKELGKALESSDAIAFTDKMNKLYEDKQILDDDGNVLTIKHPNGLANRISWDSDGKSGSFYLTEEEDRWIRANQLYGSNILGKLGFKYTDG